MDICKRIPVIPVFVWFFLDKKTSKVFLFTGMCSVDILIFQCQIHIVRFVIGLYLTNHMPSTQKTKSYSLPNTYITKLSSTTRHLFRDTFKETGDLSRRILGLLIKLSWRTEGNGGRIH